MLNSARPLLGGLFLLGLGGVLVAASGCGGTAQSSSWGAEAGSSGSEDSGAGNGNSDNSDAGSTTSPPPSPEAGSGLAADAGSDAGNAPVGADGAVAPPKGDGGNGGGADAGTPRDASAPADAGTIVDAGTPAVDANDPCADQAVWLTPMNAARATVNAGEPPLVCDPIAVQVATNYAQICTWAHNANRNANYTALGGAKTGVGENIAAGEPTQTIAAAVASWVSEGQFYNHATNTCSAPAGQDCGHYTQIVWKTTTAVGCAKVHCTTGTPFTGAGTGWDFSVCDYSPPGNFVVNGVQQPPY